ncbi:MAG: sialidase family protein [Opitutales bacterium]
MKTPTSVSRRSFLKSALVASAAPAVIVRGLGHDLAKAGPFGPVRREVFLAAPRPDVAVIASTSYRRLHGNELISVHELMSRSDTVDIAYYRYSSDNGRTWMPGEEFPTFGVRPHGKLRRASRAFVVDPATGRLLRFYLEAILPTDDPLEGFRQWMVRYSVSEDGGMTWYLDEQTMQKGPEFNADHPMAGVRRGHTGFMIGDVSSRPIYLRDGTLLVPIVIAPAGPDGNYFNPGGGYTYSDAAVLRGRWAADGRHLEWELSSLVRIDPNLSTRGMDEPTVVEMPDGGVLMVLRGSNDKRPQLPGRRWVSRSPDGGRTWTKPEPWTYENGEAFFSPASSSQFLAHSSGRIFWLGNIVPANPTGNRPRYPYVIGEVDRVTGHLIKASVTALDTRGPGDGELLALASGTSREDRETGEIVTNMTRWGALSHGGVYNWTANAYLYRIPLA